MRILNKARIDDCIARHPEVEGQMLEWLRRAEQAAWATPLQLKAEYPRARVISDNRAIFELMWNRYRVVVRINYALKLLDVRFAGSHREYDRINAETI